MEPLIMPPGEQRCTFYVAAMLFDTTVNEIARRIGFDGKTRLFQRSQPCTRPIHFFEWQPLALSFGYATLWLEPMATHIHPHTGETVDLSAVLTNTTLPEGVKAGLFSPSHAVAFIDGVYYDPVHGVIPEYKAECKMLVVPVTVQPELADYVRTFRFMNNPGM